MGIIDIVLWLADKVPELPISSKTKIKALNKNITVKRYSSSAFFIAFAVGIGAIIFSIPIALILFALTFYFLLKLPDMELKKEETEMEGELPFFMRELGFLLQTGLPFESALDISSKEKGKLSEKIISAIGEIKSGSTFQKAISRIAIESGSSQIKRAFSALISAYEQGNGASLEKISDELLMIQRHAIKDASSRLALFGLLFIAFSAVAPTFFIIYFILGESIFQSNISPFAFTTTMLILFPAISILILALASSMLPSFGQKDKFCINPIEFYKNQKRKEELEKYLPDALLSISSVPSGSSTETAFTAVTRGNYGILAKEFEISLKQLRSKISLHKVLDDLSKRNNSPMLSKAADMLSHLFSTNNFPMAAKLAQDFLAEQEISRERANAFSMQKYTLFFGAVIIPIILSITISLSADMAKVIGKNSGMDTSYVLQAYLLAYCAMVAYFSAYIENKKSLAIVYFLALCTLSLLTFNMVKLLW